MQQCKHVAVQGSIRIGSALALDLGDGRDEPVIQSYVIVSYRLLFCYAHGCSSIPKSTGRKCEKADFPSTLGFTSTFSSNVWPIFRPPWPRRCHHRGKAPRCHDEHRGESFHK